MPPKRAPAVDQWAYDHEHVGGTKYCFRWDYSRGTVTRRDRGTTGWIICTRAFSGDTEVELPPLLSQPVRAHFCFEYPCKARWGEKHYRNDAPPQPLVHLLPADAPDVLRCQPSSAIPPSPSSRPPAVPAHTVHRRISRTRPAHQMHPIHRLQPAAICRLRCSLHQMIATERLMLCPVLIRTLLLLMLTGSGYYSS